jgi:MFS family permease
MSRAEVVRALSGLMLGMFVAILASTIVSNALPRIVADLGGSQSVYTWIVTTELLSMTATVPLWGKPADLYSKKVADPGLALAARGRVADCRIHAQCGRSDPQTDRAGRRRAAAEEPAPAVECPEVKLGTGLITAGVSTLLIWSTLAGRHRRRRPSRW